MRVDNTSEKINFNRIAVLELLTEYKGITKNKQNAKEFPHRKIIGAKISFLFKKLSSLSP
jgi:hypothetical protein